MTHSTPSKYGAKEYYGERPCIDPLTMAELRLRISAQSNKQTCPARVLTILSRIITGVFK